MSNGQQAAADGAPITVAGVEYRKGLGVDAPSAVTVALNGCRRFTAVVGQDAEDATGSVAFQVEGDGRGALEVGCAVLGTRTASPDVDVSGVSQLRLVVDPLGSNGHDHADWADSQVVGCNS